MHVACCQFDIAWEDKPANYAKVESMVGGVGLPPGALLVLPEMFATGFSMNAGSIAERPDGPTARFLGGLARTHGIFVLGGLAVSRGRGKPRNEAMLFDPAGGSIARYAKMHLFGFAGEGAHYAAGDVPGGLPLAGCVGQVAICYDLRFPEVFRTAGGVRPELLAVIANWPAARESHWLALLRARAIENQAYVAAVNRCGSDPHLAYAGRSQIIDPKGETVCDAGGGEGLAVAEMDLGALRAYRRAFPALGDVREDLVRGDGSGTGAEWPVTSDG